MSSVLSNADILNSPLPIISAEGTTTVQNRQQLKEMLPSAPITPLHIAAELIPKESKPKRTSLFASDTPTIQPSISLSDVTILRNGRIELGTPLRKIKTSYYWDEVEIISDNPEVGSRKLRLGDVIWSWSFAVPLVCMAFSCLNIQGRNMRVVVKKLSIIDRNLAAQLHFNHPNLLRLKKDFTSKKKYSKIDFESVIEVLEEKCAPVCADRAASFEDVVAFFCRERHPPIELSDTIPPPLSALSVTTKSTTAPKRKRASAPSATTTVSTSTASTTTIDADTKPSASSDNGLLNNDLLKTIKQNLNNILRNETNNILRIHDTTTSSSGVISNNSAVEEILRTSNIDDSSTSDDAIDRLLQEGGDAHKEIDLRSSNSSCDTVDSTGGAGVGAAVGTYSPDCDAAVVVRDEEDSDDDDDGLSTLARCLSAEDSNTNNTNNNNTNNTNNNTSITNTSNNNIVDENEEEDCMSMVRDESSNKTGMKEVIKQLADCVQSNKALSDNMEKILMRSTIMMEKMLAHITDQQRYLQQSNEQLLNLLGKRVLADHERDAISSPAKRLCSPNSTIPDNYRYPL